MSEEEAHKVDDGVRCGCSHPLHINVSFALKRRVKVSNAGIAAVIGDAINVVHSALGIVRAWEMRFY